MIQLLAYLLTFAFPLQFEANAAPVPDGAGKASLYFPTTVGSKWVYDLDDKDETETITAVEKKEGAFLVTVQKVDQFGKESFIEMKVADDGIFMLSGLADKHPPSHRLKLPHKASATWETYTGAWPLGTSKFTAHGPEQIEVPAGKYEAIRVESQNAAKMGPDIRRTYWYAPGIGLVKYTSDHGKIKLVRTLKSFTLGKK